MSLIGSIPNLTLPKSKYSSTDTELSSDDSENSSIGQTVGIGIVVHSASGFSTSAASSSGSSWRRRRRRRTLSGRISSSSIISTRSSRSVGSTGAIIARQTISQKEAAKAWNMNERKTRNLPVLSSIHDLKHATGRHRGVSGSSAPAIDAALFAMFYVTDVFDELLSENLNHLLSPQINRNSSMKKDLFSLLRREIVYSLRINYFCPASKVVKLAQLVEEHYPLDLIQVQKDAAGFLDLLFGKLLRQAPFLTYSNGSATFIHPIHLENYFAKQYYFQPVALTMQKLLCPKNIYDTINRRKNSPNKQDNRNFATVPYPALIINIIRKAPPPDKIIDDDSMYYWDQSSETHHHNHKRPVIPNLKIDITNLISRSSTHKEHGDLHKSYSNIATNWNENVSFTESNSFMSSFKSEKVEPSASENEDEVEKDQGVTESRILKGLKSAWKVMFQYLEDLTVSSSHISVHDSPSPSIDENNDKPDTATFQKRKTKHNDYKEKWHSSLSVDKINNLSSLSPSLLSLPVKNELEDSFFTSKLQQIDVKMELIAVICKSRKNSENEKESGSKDTFSGYSVYCKAGHDIIVKGEMPHYAPWVLYQSRSGSAPQVVLIENFGKWINSLENHHESLNLYEVPMEIRRVLEDSHLFIYKRLEK